MRVLKTEDCFYVSGGEEGGGGDVAGGDANDGSWGGDYGGYFGGDTQVADTQVAGLGRLGRGGFMGVWGNALYDGLKWGVDGLINGPQPGTPNNDIDFTNSPLFNQGA